MVLKALNITFGGLVVCYALLVVGIAVSGAMNVHDGAGQARLVAAVVEFAALIAYLYALVRSFDVFDRGQVGLAFLMSIGGFFCALFVQFSACLSTISFH